MRLRLAIALTPLLLASCGGGGGGNGNPPQPNRPPSFTSAQTASVTENQTAAYQAAASDPDGNPLTFTIDGGTDAALFSITPAGALTFKTAPDYDLAGDANGDNVYAVQLRVSDGSESVTQPVNITVTNSREGIQVVRIGSGFNQPTFVFGLGFTYVLEKTGAIYHFGPSGEKTIFKTIQNISTAGEGGLLGMASKGLPPIVQPWETSNRYVIYCTNAAGDIEIRLYEINDPLPRDILTIPHPGSTNHFGGSMVFGPDGFLYAAVGDGGGFGDPGNNAQNPNSRLGKILRIEVVVGPSGDFFRPAPGNPYAGGGGDPYVYALGLRNPFRMSFSGSTLIIGDVGQNAIEEVNLLTTTQPGTNFGWPFMEGTRPFRGTPPAGLTAPVAEYSHGNGPQQGNSITGGYVYRGRIASLQGQYIFADFISGNIWSVPFSSLVPGQTLASSRFARRNEDFAPNAGTLTSITAFGEDVGGGTLYIADFNGDIFRVNGE
jgi:hypothetical protein